MNKKNEYITEVLSKLHTIYNKPQTELENWTNTMQFTAAVILSAQATDKGVNKATPKLFERYKTVDDFANADLTELTTFVKSINFYNMKAKRIIDAAKFIKENFKGEFPAKIEELIKIPGIGRKSANVILGEALKVEAQGVVVDTHITRVSKRLGLTTFDNQKDAEKIEEQLKEILPKSEWEFYSGSVVLHGRYICKAKKPKCAECVLNTICPSAFKI
jgi:endonuclease-3